MLLTRHEVLGGRDQTVDRLATATVRRKRLRQSQAGPHDRGIDLDRRPVGADGLWISSRSVVGLGAGHRSFEGTAVYIVDVSKSRANDHRS